MPLFYTNPRPVTIPPNLAGTAGTALNALLADLPAAGGKIEIPAGQWTLDTAVLANKIDTVIEGYGPATQLLFNSATVPTAIKMADTTPRRLHLKNLRVSHSGASNGGTAIDASHFVNSTFSGLLIDGTNGATNAPQKGVVYNAGDTFYNVLADSRIEVAGAGSQGLVYDALANSNVARNVRIVPGSASVGVLVDAQAILLDHVDVEVGALVAVDVATDGHACTLVAPYLEANATNLRIAAAVEALSIFGGWIADATTANITDNGSQGLSVRGLWLQYSPSESSGTTAFGAAVTSVTGIAHGLSQAPAAKNFKFSFTADPLAAGFPWPSAITSSTFTLNLKTAPGGAGTTVAWQAQVL